MPRLEGLKHSLPLHATHLTGTVSGLRGLSFGFPYGIDRWHFIFSLSRFLDRFAL